MIMVIHIHKLLNALLIIVNPMYLYKYLEPMILILVKPIVIALDLNVLKNFRDVTRN